MNRQNIVLGTSDTIRVDFTLQIGDVSETVSVVDHPQEVETEQGRFSGRIERQQLNDLPINGRNIYSLLALQPGITGRAFRFGGGVDANAPFGGGSQVNIHASGARADSNDFSVDDASVNGTADGGVAKLTPNADSVEEVRVVSNNFLAVDCRNITA